MSDYSTPTKVLRLLGQIVYLDITTFRATALRPCLRLLRSDHLRFRMFRQGIRHLERILSAFTGNLFEVTTIR